MLIPERMPSLCHDREVGCLWLMRYCGLAHKCSNLFHKDIFEWSCFKAFHAHEVISLLFSSVFVCVDTPYQCIQQLSFCLFFKISCKFLSYASKCANVLALWIWFLLCGGKWECVPECNRVCVDMYVSCCGDMLHACCSSHTMRWDSQWVCMCMCVTMRRSMGGSRKMGRCQLVYCRLLGAAQSVQPSRDNPSLSVHRSGLGREAHCRDYFSQSSIL